MKISIQSFKGVSPRVNPRYLDEGGAQVALNVEAFGQSVKPMKDLSAALTGPVLVSGAKTVYRAGLNAPSDAYWWLSWNTDVDVCRAQIAGDNQEWHFWTGDTANGVFPKAGCSTYTIGNNTAPYPNTKSFRLGLPAPEKKPEGAVSYVTPEKKPVKLVLTASILAEFTTWNYVNQSCDVQAALDKDANGYRWYYPTTINTALLVYPTMTLTAATIATMTPDYGLKLSIDNEVNVTAIDLSHLTKEQLGAQTLTAEINLQAKIRGVQFVTATQVGNDVKLVVNVAGGALRFVARWGEDDYSQRLVVNGTPLSAEAVRSAFAGTWAYTNNPLTTVTGSTLLDLTVDGSSLIVETKAPYVGGGWCSVAPYDTEESCTANGGTWTPPAFFAVRWGPASYQQVVGYGTTENKGTYESRTYVYTWVSKPGWSSTYPDGFGLTMESAPSPPSDIANVYADSKVLMQIFTDPDGAGPKQAIFPDGSTVMGTGAFRYLKLADGREIHAIRLYRSVNGVFLLVTEGSISDAITVNNDVADALGNKHYCFVDDYKADKLGEPCPSILWSEPPAALKGLINLPNGMVAGFVERDLYVCEPYRPYAWPESYINTLDYKIVGLGRMDTTLAVLTEGAPYFIQGSDPNTLVVVKSDIEQACVAKRSIVSMGGIVLYASPDGLIMLRPGGSDILTESVFDRAAWQNILGTSPSTTFHAYGHDGKYIAFHRAVTDNSVTPAATYTGFVVDLRSKQFVRHSFTCDCAYADPVNDHLYLASGGLLRKWGEGGYVANARWRSKVFAMPQISGFVCAQVEADVYDSSLKCQLYRDKTKVVTGLANDAPGVLAGARLHGRYPFRLEPQQGRDWEIDLNPVTQEVFNVVLAQSMSEIAQS